MVDWSMAVADPWKSIKQGNDYVNQIYDMAGNRDAAQRYAAGDYQGAASAAASRGDLKTTQAITDRGNAVKAGGQYASGDYAGAAGTLARGGDIAGAEAVTTKQTESAAKQAELFQKQHDLMQRAVPFLKQAVTTDPNSAAQAFDMIAQHLQAAGTSPEMIAKARQQFLSNPIAWIQQQEAMTAIKPEYKEVDGQLYVINPADPTKPLAVFGEKKQPAPTTRNIIDGNSERTQQFDPKTNTWVDLGAPGPRFRPQAPAGASQADRRFGVQLRSQFNNEADVKAFNDVAASYDIISKVASAAPTAANDMSLIFAYMKMLDPGSVVREGEFANAQNSAGIPDQIRNAYNKALNGQRLNPGQRQQFVGTARNIYGSRKSRYDQIVKQYQGYAADSNLPDGTIQPRIEAGAPSAADNVSQWRAPMKAGGGRESPAPPGKVIDFNDLP